MLILKPEKIPACQTDCPGLIRIEPGVTLQTQQMKFDEWFYYFFILFVLFVVKRKLPSKWHPFCLRFLVEPKKKWEIT